MGAALPLMDMRISLEVMLARLAGLRTTIYLIWWNMARLILSLPSVYMCWVMTPIIAVPLAAFFLQEIPVPYGPRGPLVLKLQSVQREPIGRLSMIVVEYRAIP